MLAADCHCLFPCIKSVPTENIELYFPLIIEANEAVADSGGPGYFRGGNAQRTLYRFLSEGEVSIHDDRWFIKPWGVNGGRPGSLSSKKLWKGDSFGKEGAVPELLPSKCDHVRVQPGDVLEWQTWGGGGLGDPLTRPAEIVAAEVHRKLVTFEGAAKNYGVVVKPSDFSVNVGATEELRQKMRGDRDASAWDDIATGYNRGGTVKDWLATCEADTGIPAPKPQWEKPLYGPHVALPYVQEWYKKMKETGGWVLEDAGKL